MTTSRSDVPRRFGWRAWWGVGPRPLGPDGERLCKMCPKPVAKGRFEYCSEGCAIDYRVRTSGASARWHVYKRDAAVCAACGEQVRCAHLYCATHYESICLNAPYEVDHIIPVIEGGGGTGLDNLRTLCIPCHRAVTKELRGRLAAKRRGEKVAV